MYDFKHFKEDLKDWTVGKSKFGFKGKSPINPYTHGFWVAKQWLTGARRGRAAANLSKHTGMIGSRGLGNSGQTMVVAPARSARTISSLTTH